MTTTAAKAKTTERDLIPHIGGHDRRTLMLESWKVPVDPAILRGDQKIKAALDRVANITAYRADTLAELAKVEASIQADSILISGEVKGNIVAKRKITLNRTARLTGDLSTPGIVIEEGAKLEGQIVIGGDAPAAEKKQATARQAPAKRESAPATPPARSPGVTLPAS